MISARQQKVTKRIRVCVRACACARMCVAVTNFITQLGMLNGGHKALMEIVSDARTDAHLCWNWKAKRV